MIGRQKEQKDLIRLYNGNTAEFVAVYGRRRVGKTYLIQETFRDRIAFKHAGLSPVENAEHSTLPAQLEQFYYSLLKQGMKEKRRPKSWLEAFYMLETLLEEKDDGSRQVVFLDELPWMDTPKSGFITALEGFWNNWGCARSNLMLIVCGSASSWILDKLINNHGGLYGRITYQIKLQPFTLRECEALLESADVKLSRYDITQSHMIVGGIPYYLRYYLPGNSLAQNIDRMFFEKQAPLKNEYELLFSSIFGNPDTMKSLVEFLFTRNAGYTRKEIAEKLGMSSGGVLTNNLNALISSDFVVPYVPFGYSKREVHYKLVDPFCLFWLHFVKNKHGLSEDFWQQGQTMPAVVAWRGLAFEQVCFSHIRQIKKALGIEGVQSRESAWSKRDDNADGAQIDLLIERNDDVLNACEIKFYGDDFRVDKDYHRILLRRQDMLRKEISPKISIHHTLITTFGLAYNEYSSIFSKVLTMDDLFV